MELKKDASVAETRSKKNKKDKKEKNVPKKTTLNLMVTQKTSIEAKKWIPGVLIVLVLGALFGKFAVADRFDRLDRAESELSAMEQRLEDTRAAYADYDEVEEQYNVYNYTGFDKTIADRLEVLGILERNVFPMCRVSSFSVTGRNVNLSLVDLDLNQLSTLIERLNAEPLVESVNVPSASRGNEDSPFGTATMTVTLADASTLQEGGAENE